MRHLALEEVLRLHEMGLSQADGLPGIRDAGALEAALAQPQMTFGGEDLYPTLVDKAAALGFSLVLNHPFIDGNKRVGHAAMETLLVLNGYEIEAPVDEQEHVVLCLAAGDMDREAFTAWLNSRVMVRRTG